MNSGSVMKEKCASIWPLKVHTCLVAQKRWFTWGRPFNSIFTHVNMTSVRLTTAWKFSKSNLSAEGLSIKPDQALWKSPSMSTPNTRLSGDRERNSVAHSQLWFQDKSWACVALRGGQEVDAMCSCHHKFKTSSRPLLDIICFLHEFPVMFHWAISKAS